MPSNLRDCDKTNEMAETPLSYEEQLKYLSPISKPLASDKTTRHALKLIKKGANALLGLLVNPSLTHLNLACKEKAVHRGVKEIVKVIRRNHSGICVIAGDIAPIDVIAHIPVLCEDHNVRYIYVPSKEYLGAASMTRRPTSCVFVNCPKNSSSYQKRYSKFLAEIEKIWSNYRRAIIE